MCCNICLELGLQKLNDEHFQLQTVNIDDKARLDISANGFWERSERAFFDVRVFNPFAPTNLKHPLESSYCLHEMKKRRQYDECVLKVQQGSFTPLVFSTSGAWEDKPQSFQTPCLPACQEKGPSLHPRNWVDQMPLGILSPFILHHLPEGHKIYCRIHPQPHLRILKLWTSQSVRARFPYHEQ